jgi:hypothetical protein
MLLTDKRVLDRAANVCPRSPMATGGFEWIAQPAPLQRLQAAVD